MLDTVHVHPFVNGTAQLFLPEIPDVLIGSACLACPEPSRGSRIRLNMHMLLDSYFKRDRVCDVDRRVACRLLRVGFCTAVFKLNSAPQKIAPLEKDTLLM